MRFRRERTSLMSFQDAFDSLPIDLEQTRGSLLVAARVFKNARNISRFNLG
jgi:hypothetical protein